MTVETDNPDRDYPRMAAERGQVEPSPRRVRGFVQGGLVFDTTRARYVWEKPYYPYYYVPIEDVVDGVLIDERHQQKLQFGTSSRHGIAVGSSQLPAVARVFGSDAVEGVAGTVRFEFEALDWFEEDEPILGHPRNPYVRVDALRSHRHVVVAHDGVVLADTTSPVLLFETGLPTRYYIDRTDVDFSHLTPTLTQTVCPYKGITSGYWSTRGIDRGLADIAWAYDFPFNAVTGIAGLVAFYNESLDITVDDRPLSRPRTHFT